MSPFLSPRKIETRPALVTTFSGVETCKELSTGHDLTRGSGHEVFGISRVGSGPIRRSFKLSRVGWGHSYPTRPARFFTRPVNSPGKVLLGRATPCTVLWNVSNMVQSGASPVPSSEQPPPLPLLPLLPQSGLKQGRHKSKRKAKKDRENKTSQASYRGCNSVTKYHRRDQENKGRERGKKNESSVTSVT